jgi:exodeoxyribonuclease V beta subunit
MSTQVLNALTLPLNGIQVIEASAGTGKTYTLAALYVRLVLGHGLARGPLTPPDILVMTFTEAATAELRERIRSRLTQAARDFRSDAEPTDMFLRDLKRSIDAQMWPQCAWRLDAAAQWMDEAAIFTIHGWSSRMLRQHAFDSSSLFEQSTVEDSEALRLRVTTDYWREWYYPLTEAQLDALAKVGRTPTALMHKLQALWRVQERSPASADDAAAEPETPTTVIARWTASQAQVTVLQDQARALWRQHWPVVADQLQKAMDNDLNGVTYKATARTAYLAQLQAWTEGAELDAKLIKNFGLATLIEKTKAKKTLPTDHTGAYGAMQALNDARIAVESPEQALLAHAAHNIAQRYERSKQQLAQFDFSDLLTRLHAALHLPDSRLPQVIRRQYPVALVDEFQDTDPWQWGALSMIYPDAQATDVGLLLIGDPKQAIYSFRGADLNTYAAARVQAQGVHTLSYNYRSTRQVIAAVNHVFSHALTPFDGVPFLPAMAPDMPKAQPLVRQGAGVTTEAVQPAMTVWHLDTDKPLSAAAYLQTFAERCASEMVKLLNSGDAQPADMAVLVRDGSEARAIRQALQVRGVRSVYLSDRDSVFATREALDLWHVLCAVAQPQSVQHLRCALSCRTLGLSAHELAHLLQNEDAWDAQVEMFSRWNLTWQRQGFLPLLYQWLHEQHIAQRLTASTTDPERRLTNLLHLGDLLQKASLSLQGQGAVLRYLADQLHNPQASGEAAQMRLETDAHLVQVITMHKSKGLQFPLVFLPFIANFRKEKADAVRSDAERLAEDKRLLYVALTRAEQALFLGVANRRNDFTAKGKTPSSALSALLGRTDANDLTVRLQGWATCPDVQVVPAPDAVNDVFQPATAAPLRRAALTPRRHHHSLWWMASFSALTRKSDATAAQSALPSESDERWLDAQTDSREALDTVTPDASPARALPYNEFKAGSAYGTLLHDLLEWQLTEGWPIVATACAVTDQEVALEAGLRWEQLFSSQTAALQLDAAQTDLLAQWLLQIVRTPLPLGVALGDGSIPDLALADLTRESAWPEMNFTLLTQGVKATTLDHIITTHVLPAQPREPLQMRTLQGLLTGFMDVVFEHAGRYYVLDYKSNKLAGYSQPEMAQGMLAHRYDVQLSLYLLALHRLLKARLPGYDYAKHMGGAVYLFARGIDQSGAGVWAYRPPQAMVDALDGALRSPT